jgi:heme exporter protein B
MMLDASPSRANKAAKTGPRGKQWPTRLRRYLQVVAAIAAKDLRSEARGRKILAVWATFGLLLFMVFYLSLNISQIAFQTVAPAVLWVIFALISTMALGRGFNQEHELGGWQALLISPINHSAIYFGKLISNLVVTLIAEIAVLVGFSLLYHWPVDTMGMLIVLVLGTLGLMAVGTFVAAYVADKGGVELLLPLMVLPVVIPVIALAGQMTAVVLSQPLSSDWLIVLVFLVGYDAITVLGGAAAFSWIAELY